MLYNYIALVFFSVFAVLVPLGYLLGTKLLGRKSAGNAVRMRLMRAPKPQWKQQRR